MSASKRRKGRGAVPPAMSVEILTKRAHELAGELGHELQPHWRHAKKRYGPGALHTYCKDCLLDIVIAPKGNPMLGTSLREVPSISGDALAVMCEPMLSGMIE